MIILIWELIPTSVVIILFRLRVNLFQSCYNNNNNNRLNANIQSTVSVFLDNETNNETLSDDDEQAFNNYYNRSDPVSYQSSKNLINANYYY